jgi:hypothetical protein
MQHLDKLYKKHDIAWFTPVGLFKVPFLGSCFSSCKQNEVLSLRY